MWKSAENLENCCNLPKFFTSIVFYFTANTWIVLSHLNMYLCCDQSRILIFTYYMLCRKSSNLTSYSSYVNSYVFYFIDIVLGRCAMLHFTGRLEEVLWHQHCWLPWAWKSSWECSYSAKHQEVAGDQAKNRELNSWTLLTLSNFMISLISEAV